jgi:hypothetical protein
MASETLLFLKETGAPHFKRPVSVIHHPEFPPLRFEVLYRVGRPGKYEVKTHWFGRKPDALKFAKFAHEASEADILQAISE